MRTDYQLLSAKLNEITSNFSILKDQIDEAKEWDNVTKVIANVSKLRDFTINVVAAVELASSEIQKDAEVYAATSNEDKLNVAVKYLDDAIKLPFWLELFDEFALKIILSVAVDHLNKELGHDWDIHLIREALNIGVNFEEHIKNKLIFAIDKELEL